MLFVLLAACCSVLVSVMLKVARRREIDIVQAIGWNYLAAAVLCYALLDPQLGALKQPGTPWPSLIGLAFVLPSLFVVLAVSVRRAGIVLTDIAQRLSLLLSLLAAFLLFGENTTVLKIGGLALGLLAVVGILARPTTTGYRERGRAWPALLTVWAGFALVDIMLKHIAAAGTPFAASLQVSFTLAFIGMGAWLCVRAARGHGRLSLHNAAAGLLLGALNFCNILFYVLAHKALSTQPAVVFASMNISVVVLGTLVGTIIYREPLSHLNRAAIVLAIASIMLIAWSRN